MVNIFFLLRRKIIDESDERFQFFFQKYHYKLRKFDLIPVIKQTVQEILMLYYERFVSIFISSWEVYRSFSLFPSYYSTTYKNFLRSRLYYIVNRFDIFFFLTFFKKRFIFNWINIQKKKKKKISHKRKVIARSLVKMTSASISTLRILSIQQMEVGESIIEIIFCASFLATSTMNFC